MRRLLLLSVFLLAMGAATVAHAGTALAGCTVSNGEPTAEGNGISGQHALSGDPVVSCTAIGGDNWSVKLQPQSCFGACTPANDPFADGSGSGRTMPNQSCGTSNYYNAGAGPTLLVVWGDDGNNSCQNPANYPPLNDQGYFNPSGGLQGGCNSLHSRTVFTFLDDTTGTTLRTVDSMTFDGCA